MTRARTQHVLEVPHELRALVHARATVSVTRTRLTRSSSSSILRDAPCRASSLSRSMVQSRSIDLAELLVEHVGVLGVRRVLVLREDALVVRRARASRPFRRSTTADRTRSAARIAGSVAIAGPGDHAGVDAREQRVGAEAIGAVVLVVDLAAGVEAGDVRRLVARRADLERAARVLLEVDPQAAHRVVDGREDLHRVLVRIDADELLVDLEDARELLAQERLVLVREVEVDLVLVLAGLGVVDAALLVEAVLKIAREAMSRGTRLP